MCWCLFLASGVCQASSEQAVGSRDYVRYDVRTTEAIAFYVVFHENVRLGFGTSRGRGRVDGSTSASNTLFLSFFRACSAQKRGCQLCSRLFVMESLDSCEEIAGMVDRLAAGNGVVTVVVAGRECEIVWLDVSMSIRW